MHFCICFCLFVFVHLTPPSPLCALLVSYVSAQITTPSISVALITLDHPNHVTRHRLLMMIVIILTRANNLEYDDHDDLEEVNFQEQASNCRTLLSAGDPFAGFANKEGGQFPILNFLLK